MPIPGQTDTKQGADFGAMQGLSPYIAALLSQMVPAGSGGSTGAPSLGGLGMDPFGSFLSQILQHLLAPKPQAAPAAAAPADTGGGMPGGVANMLSGLGFQAWPTYQKDYGNLLYKTGPQGIDASAAQAWDVKNNKWQANPFYDQPRGGGNA